MVIKTGPISELMVDQGSRTGTVKLQNDPTIYRIANNSDTGFQAMVDVLSSAKGNDKNVSLDVGPGEEIDRIIFK